MGRKTKERETAADINIKSSDALIYNYRDTVTINDELSELKDKIAAIEDNRQPSSKHRRKISVKVYV